METPLSSQLQFKTYASFKSTVFEPPDGETIFYQERGITVHMFFRYNRSFKGVARLVEGDVWDEEIGKNIARRIALKKYYIYLKKIAEESQRLTMKDLLDYQTFIVDIEDKIEKIDGYIEKM